MVSKRFLKQFCQVRYKQGGGNLCQREYVILVAKKKTSVEEKSVLMGTSYAQIVFMADFSGQHAQHAHYVESL